jgi:PAS domain S-box-containing protein
MFKIGLRQSRSKTIAAYIASLVAVPATTWILASIQHFLNRLDGQFPRPFGIGFLVVVAAISLLGGSGPGLFSLLLSGIFTIYFLVEPFQSWHIHRPIDAVEVCIELSVGLILVTAIQLLHRSRRHSQFLLEQSQITQARLQTIMDVAPVGVLTCDENGYLNYANKEAERLWGQPLEPGGPDTWGRYGLRSADGKKRLPGETGLLRALQRNEEVVRDDVIITRPDNTEIFAQASSAAILDQNTLRGAMCAMIDVTERRQAEIYREQALKLSREIAEREGLLNRIGQAQRASADPDQVQLVAAEELGKAIMADRCCFVAVNVSSRRIQITHEWHQENVSPVDTAQVLDNSKTRLTDLFLTLDETISINDVTTNHWTRDLVTEYYVQQLRSQLFVPLMEEGLLVGVLLVAMAEQPREWSEAEIFLVEAVAAQTRTSVNLALFLQREHNIAERLQEALMPSLVERFPGLDMDFYYQPALSEATIGGDFFDVFPAEKGNIALVVGDLSGKGLAAASQIATVRNMLRFALYQDRDLARAIRTLNDILVEHNLLQGFVTLFIGIYDASNKILTYVSCGHETALLRRHVTNTVEELEPTGPIMGAFAGADFEEGSVKLEVGDALLMFTDGLSEAGRNRHEFLGVEGLIRLLKEAPLARKASDCISCVIEGVTAHNQGVIHDDQCLVAAVIEGHPTDGIDAPDSLGAG